MTDSPSKFFGYAIEAKLINLDDSHLAVSIHDPDTQQNWESVFVYHRDSKSLEENEAVLEDLIGSYREKIDKPLGGLLSLNNIISNLFDFLEAIVSTLFDSFVGFAIIVILIAIMALLLSTFFVVLGISLLVILFIIIKTLSYNRNKEIRNLREYVEQTILNHSQQ